MNTTTTITVEHNGVTYQGEVMRVERTELGYEDHGVFTAWLHLASEGASQGMGGYFLDEPGDEQYGPRRGTAFGMDQVMRIVDTAGVRSWEALKGLRIIALRTEPYGYISGFKALSSDRVFILTEHSSKWNPKKAS